MCDSEADGGRAITAADLLNGGEEAKPAQPQRARLVEIKAYIRQDQLEWLNAQAAKRGNGKHQRNAVIKQAIDAAMELEWARDIARELDAHSPDVPED